MKQNTGSKLLSKFNNVEGELEKTDVKYSIDIEKITQFQTKPDVVTNSYLKTIKLLFVFLTMLVSFIKVNFLILRSVFSQGFRFLRSSNENLEKSLKENIHLLDEKISLRTSHLQSLKSYQSEEETKILNQLNVNFKNGNIAYENKLIVSFEEKLIVLKNIQNVLAVINQSITNKGMDKSIENVKVEISQKGKNLYYDLSFSLSQMPYRWTQFFFKFVKIDLQDSLSQINSKAEYELLTNCTLGNDVFTVRIGGGDLQSVLKNTNQKEIKPKTQISLFEVGPQ